MSDKCGHETPNGPCQNPTTPDNPDGGDTSACWIPSHNDPDADNPHGREFTITDDDHEDILEAARMGLSQAGCARAAGVDEKNLRRYLDSNDDFRRDFARARSKGERKLVKGALFNEAHAEREMDGQHARFLLSTSFDYVKTEKREVDMDADVDGEVRIDFSNVDT